MKSIREMEAYRASLDAIAQSLPAGECRILITGASGLIGSCVTDALILANQRYGARYQIYALSRSAEKLAARFGGETSVRLVAQDIAAPIAIDGLDYIVHAASNADPRSYARYPAETILTNVLGAKSVLDYCRRRTTRPLLTSTFEVYGRLEQDEYAEEDYGLLDENQLRSAYPESKRTAELLFRAFHDEYGVDGVIARLPSVYGPAMSEQDNKAHAEFIRNAVRGEAIILKSSGQQRRTYSYVMDVVSGLLFLLFQGQSGEAYNVANDSAVASIAELAKLIADLAGTEVVFQAASAEEKKGYSRPQNVILKADKIRRLGWQPRYGLEQGLRETLDIVRQLG